MKLFGRNKNKEEINDIKLELNSLKEVVQESLVENTYQSQINELKKKIDENNSKNESLFKQHENKLLELDAKIENLKNIFDKFIDMQKSIIDSNTSKEGKESISILEVNDLDKHLYNVKYGAEPYQTLILEGNRIKGARGHFEFTIEDIINIKENLQEYHDKNYSCLKIGRLHGINKGSINRVIWNIEEGNFDELIKEYKSGKVPVEEGYHKMRIADSFKVAYLEHTIDDDGELYISTGKKMPYTIKDIIELKEAIENVNNHSINDVLNSFDYSYSTGCRLIWNIEEGNFDELIEKWNRNNDEANDETAEHFRKISKSLHKRLSNNIRLLDGGELISNGRTLSYTIQDVLRLQERIPNFNKYPTFADLFRGFDMMTETSLKLLVWRIEEGEFDELINEYLSRNYTYENNFNRLFIDGKNTGLSIDKCISMVDCIVNSNDKLNTVNKLIKMYPSVDSKYIRIISEEYNNPNLGKVLKKEVRKIPKINNPQKRREQGVFQ